MLGDGGVFGRTRYRQRDDLDAAFALALGAAHRHDEVVASLFTSRTRLLMRDSAECFEEALIAWTKRQSSRAAMSSRIERLNDKPCIYYRVSPAIWAVFTSRAAELRLGISECVDFALRGWLDRTGAALPRRTGLGRPR